MPDLNQMRVASTVRPDTELVADPVLQGIGWRSRSA